ncbi:hypothetical protein ADUPG1_000130 [Aduncisulcus paluster]|uniref:DNA2/NAM7 helicase-like C-terminal domain-containing protein n=1 Tax=Aduncisulcus paluster TaxID=2918883 RepID=A0ABQ5K932_9EUKA|nr:hypothetical protein ADUPG1_000130 [Aduncisulcus paluster]
MKSKHPCSSVFHQHSMLVLALQFGIRMLESCASVIIVVPLRRHVIFLRNIIQQLSDDSDDVLDSSLRDHFPLSVHTVDSVQGKSVDGVVYVGTGNVGMASNDNRVNVAITRCRRRLCVLCDDIVVKASTKLQQIYSLVRKL